jgi:DNA polymerase-3 subunit alpha
MGQADLLRRAMGKKIAAEMATHRQIFINGAGERGIARGVAETIFEQAAKFAGYGFNKGHAAAYAQVAYQTAYLKANYPTEFLAASMTLDIGTTDRLNVFRQEAGRLGIKVLPPDINQSDAFFTCDSAAGVIFYALAAVKGVGRQAMEHVVAMREQEGPFRSIADFARRVDVRHVNKRAFESLARAGAFSALSPNRRQLVESSDAILSDAARTTRERESGQSTLFGATAVAEELHLVSVADWLPHERLGEEFSAIGFYLSGHPLDAYDAALKRLGVVSWAALQEDRRRSSFRAMLAGTIIRKQERRGRNDQPYGFLSLSDPTGMFEIMVFSEVLLSARPLLEAGKSVLLSVAADWIDEELKLRALSVSDLDQAAAQAGEGLRIRLDDAQPLNAIAGQMRANGKGIVTLIVPGAEGQDVEIRLKDRHQITAAMKSTIQSLPGVAAVESV